MQDFCILAPNKINLFQVKIIRIFFLVCVLPLLAFTSVHKYYISVTQINYIEDKQSVQIISRIFIDDFENVLRERYDETLILAEKDESKTINIYIERYLKEKLKVKVNNKKVQVNFIGKEYDNDIMRCYLEIENVNSIDALEITNQVLFDLYKEQQNIIKTKIYSEQKSYILIPQKDTALLKFN